MNTTEIFVEQLLIGLLVISLGVSIAYGNPFEKRDKAAETAAAGKPEKILINANLDKPAGVDKPVPIIIRAEVDNLAANNNNASTFDVAGPVAEFIFGTLLLAIAYFIGIAYDRISDTLLQDFERHNRLKVAWKEIRKKIVSRSKDDSFPLHEIRLNVFRDQAAVTAHAAYLRSRMRISRSLATLVPLVPLAVLMYFAGNDVFVSRADMAIFVFFLYTLFLALKIFKMPEGPPKTNVSNYILYSYMCCRLVRTKDDRCYFRLIYYDYIREPLTIAVVIIAVLTYILSAYVIRNPFPTSLLYFLAVIVMTLSVGWVWWRISETYNQFLLTHYEDSIQESDVWLSRPRAGKRP